MNPIPIYDDTVPIACTADRALIPQRIDMAERMRDQLRSLERTAHGVLLTFPADDAIRALVDRFTVDEKECCRFWGFEVHDDPSTITLRWDGPPAVTDFFEELTAFFHSDQPLTAFSGLL